MRRGARQSSPATRRPPHHRGPWGRGASLATVKRWGERVERGKGEEEARVSLTYGAHVGPSTATSDKTRINQSQYYLSNWSNLICKLRDAIYLILSV